MHHIVMFDCSGPLTLDGFENSGADWLEASDTLATKLASKRDGKQFDADAMIAAAKADLEERHDFLRDD